MSYRVDIPTLSANEVYTLTFEYEGTETIQLIVGDLTLETTDRRVVFTTTSPVNYIESNVNLTNLNIYEGYYESDDFGGEYTQESYIEGKSLINLKDSMSYSIADNWYRKMEILEDGYKRVTQIPNDKDISFANGNISDTNDFAKNLTNGNKYTVILNVRKNTFPSDVVMEFCMSYSLDDSYEKVDDDIYVGAYGMYKQIVGGQTGRSEALVIANTVQTTQIPSRYWGTLINVKTTDNISLSTTLQGRKDLDNCVIEYIVTVVEGDYYGQGIEPFSGIGCVKSPKILSQTKEPNLAETELFQMSTSSSAGSSYDKETQTISITNIARATSVAFYFQPQKWGYGDYEQFCVEFDVVYIEKVKDGEPPYFSLAQNASPRGDTKTTTPLYEGKHYTIHFQSTAILNTRDTLLRLAVNGGTPGINKTVTITNFKLYHVNNINGDNGASEVGTYDCCKISTPDDLELYKVSDTIYDKLDLTTGTLYKNTGTYVLDETFVDRTSNWNIDVHATTGNVTFTSRQHSYLRDEHNFPYSLYNNAIVSNADPASNIVNSNNIEITRPRLYFDVYSNNNYTVIIMPASYNVTTLEELRAWLQNNPMIFNYKLGTPYTEQLSLNPLKSYRNGSIQTSSQQLTPTLKTTLPISNKFTTTNLTSGSTYNVYFDGTATKLDAGGTIITDPVSPCEVECGGTTLTIEGTDIQNVRVIETTVKNEVGSVNGTTDVELKKVKACKYENILDDITYKTSVRNGAVININYDDFCIEVMGAHEWAGEFADTGLKYPSGCNLVHVEFDIDMDNPNLRMAINFNEGINNNYPQHRHITLNNDTATIAQGNYDGIYTSIITKGHFSRLMYANGDRPIIINLYTGSYITGNLATGNSAEGSIDGYETIGTNYGRITNLKMRIIENFSSNYTTVTSVLRDSSYNIIWQDMDMTIPQTISKLEQPIKLRSLGTTYDSYNLVTGELIKRIGVSETDGSYSVLSSPIVENISMGKTIENIFNFEEEWINRGFNTSNAWQLTNDGDGIYTLKALQANATARVWFSLLDAEQTVGEELTTIIEVFKNTSNKSIEYWSQIQPENGNDVDYLFNAGETGVKIQYGKFTKAGRAIDFQNIGKDSEFQFRVTIVRGLYPNIKEGFGTSKIIQVSPQLYTNGQVKVYSDSDVYPTTILNGQSTNNYEVNELNKSNNYTIRYDGECESINLANKSNEQGTNRIVKSGTDGRGNLTFVNNSEDIDNVLLVEHDVREQEINHFNGLQTVEVSGMLIETSQNMWWDDWIAPSEYGASWQVDSPEFIPVQPGETIYVVADNNNYTSLFEFDENYNIVNKGKDLILGGGSVPTPIRLDNGYYKNYKILSENTRYIKFIIPASTATTAKNEARWSVISFTKTDVGNVSLYTNNTPYRGSTINLPQPVQLNRIHKENMPYSSWSNVLGQNVKLADGIAYDSYNPITGERIQRVYKMTLNGDDGIKYIDSWSSVQYAIDDSTLPYPRKARHADTVGRYAGLIDVDGVPYGTSYNAQNDIFVTWLNYNAIALNLPRQYTNNVFNQNACKQWLRENPITLYYELETPIVTQLTPINIPTFEGGIVQLITTDGKVFPMVEYSMPTNNRYDTSSWEAGKVYTQRNMTEAYFNESTTPMTPTETMTLTTDQISSGSIILNDNGNGLIVLKGNYTGRDIPYFTGMRSVEAIEVETTPSPDQPLFGKGGRK